MNGQHGQQGQQRGTRERQARVRVRFWNIGGSIGDLTSAPARMHPGWAPRTLAGVEVLVLTETGYVERLHAADVQAWAKAQGWRQVVCSTRPYAPRSGGVAVFVRTRGTGPGDGGLARVEAQLVRDSPEFGMAWVRIRAGQGQWLYLGVCYLPPKGSTYYGKEGGPKGELSMDRHWWMLGEGVREFSQLGQVLLVGDFNARIGGRPGDGGLGPGAVGERRSLDEVWDASVGGRLLQLCEEHKLVVLNGRMPGDSKGMFTFQGGRRGRSVIDYAVACPGLVFEEGGRVRAGCRLDVWPWREIPERFTGGPYDHLPVTLTVRLPTVGGNHDLLRARAAWGESHRILRWRETSREGYVDVLVGDEEVQAKLRDVVAAPGVDQAARSLEEAVWLAAEKADALLGARKGARMVETVRPKGGGAPTSQPKNQWYDESCRKAREACLAAASTGGEGSAVAVAARKAYKRVVRGAQRAWEAQEAARWRDSLVRDPKTFWAEYKERRAAAGAGLDQWTGYLKGLFATGEARGEPDPELCDRLFREAVGGREAFEAARELNEAITEWEVRRAMRVLRRGKAAGVDGIPPEFIKEAWLPGGGGPPMNALVEPVLHLFNRVFKEGYPEVWRVGAVAPVPKKAGAVSMDEHRGIVVGAALAKLYSQVLLGRLDVWAERWGVRAKGQFGFRKGRGTDDGTFVLNHVLEAYKARGQPVYAVLVDFRKAYDSVDRGTLWRCLAQLGIRGGMLDALMDMYRRVQLRVRVGGALGPVFESERGVKQGDPLSPLLFGLLLERVEEVFEAIDPEGGVKVGGQRVVALMYADDLVILGERPEFVQRALDVLAKCCTCLRLEVNLAKTVGVVFGAAAGPGRRERVGWTYEGGRVPMADEAVYLGTRFEARKGVAGAELRLLQAARRAQYGLSRRCGVRGMASADLQLHLHRSLVKPILDFGAAIWGPGAVNAAAGGREEAEAMYLRFLRQVFGVKKSVAGAVVLREAGEGPIWAGWVRRAAAFWNRVVKRGEADLVRTAMEENWKLARDGVGECWATHLEGAMKQVAEGLGLAQPVALTTLVSLPAPLTNAGADGWWRLALASREREAISQQLEVREVPVQQRDGFKVYTHHRWFAVPEGEDDERGARFWQVLSSGAAVRRIAQLRMGSHRLAIEEGRFAKVPRGQRVCVVCDKRDREDERHYVFECERYSQIRRRYPGLFGGAGSVPALRDSEVQRWMNPSRERAAMFWPKLNAFLLECWMCRNLNMALAR